MKTEVFKGIAEGAIKGLSDLVPGIAEYQYHSSMANVIASAVVLVIALLVLAFGVRACIKNGWNDRWCVVACAAIIIVFAVVVFLTELNDVYLAKYYPEKLVLRELRRLLE